MIQSKVMLVQAIFIIVVLFLLILLLALGVIFPIWLLVRCVSSPIPTPSKLLWVAVMLLFFPPFGFYVYGLRSSSPKVRATSFGAIVAACLALTGMFIAIPYVLKNSQSVMESAIAEFDQENYLGLNPEDRGKFKASMLTLKEELGGNWLSEIENKQHAIGLLQLFQLYAADQKIDPTETKDWHDKFEIRKLLTVENILRPGGAAAGSEMSKSPEPISAPQPGKGPERPVPE